MLQGVYDTLYKLYASSGEDHVVPVAMFKQIPQGACDLYQREHMILIIFYNSGDTKY